MAAKKSKPPKWRIEERGKEFLIFKDEKLVSREDKPRWMWTEMSDQELLAELLAILKSPIVVPDDSTGMKRFPTEAMIKNVERECELKGLERYRSSPEYKVEECKDKWVVYKNGVNQRFIYKEDLKPDK